jgi:hypothetical protein
MRALLTKKGRSTMSTRTLFVGPAVGARQRRARTPLSASALALALLVAGPAYATPSSATNALAQRQIKRLSKPPKGVRVDWPAGIITLFPSGPVYERLKSELEQVVAELMHKTPATSSRNRGDQHPSPTNSKISDWWSRVVPAADPTCMSSKKGERASRR